MVQSLKRGLVGRKMFISAELFTGSHCRICSVQSVTRRVDHFCHHIRRAKHDSNARVRLSTTDAFLFPLRNIGWKIHYETMKLPRLTTLHLPIWLCVLHAKGGIRQVYPRRIRGESHDCFRALFHTTSIPSVGKQERRRIHEMLRNDKVDKYFRIFLAYMHSISHSLCFPLWGSVVQ